MRDGSLLKKSPNHCTREDGLTEYISCDSFCAEVPTMLLASGLNYNTLNSLMNALFDKRILEGSTLITTGFPCDRCTSIAIDTGIKKVIYGAYKTDKPRPKDILNAAHMTLSGIKLYQAIEDVDEHSLTKYVPKRIYSHPEIESFVKGTKRVRGRTFFIMYFDEWYREQIRSK